jgi:hypothetical protein
MDWMPGKHNEQFEMARTWLAQLPKATVGGSQTAWTVSTAEIDELEVLIEAVQDGMYDVERDIGSAIANARLKEAFTALMRYMRLIHQRKLFTPPMQDSDWIRLGLCPHDKIRTLHIEVSEAVEFELKLREIREIPVNGRTRQNRLHRRRLAKRARPHRRMERNTIGGNTVNK